MGSFDDLVEEGEEQDQKEAIIKEESVEDKEEPVEKQIEKNGLENDNNKLMSEEEQEEKKKGFFSRLKDTISTAKELKQKKEMQKLTAKEEALNKKLEYEKKKTALFNKQQQLSKMAKERRQNSPIGQTFGKIGSFVKQNTNVERATLATRPGETAFGSVGPGFNSGPMMQENYGQSAGVNFALVGRPAPPFQSNPSSHTNNKKSNINKKSKHKTKKMPSKKYQPQQPYVPQQPWGTPNFASPLNEFSTSKNKPKKSNNNKQTNDIGLFSGKW